MRGPRRRHSGERRPRRQFDCRPPPACLDSTGPSAPALPREAPMAIVRTLILLGGLASATRAQFTPIAVPSTFGFTERLMFGDLDGDGDLDVVLANGGDFGNDLNRVWINQGGLQGGTIGAFADETPARWTGILDDSRDVELVDIDEDGDL